MAPEKKKLWLNLAFSYLLSQRSDANPEDTALDAERMNNFYQRALNESER